MHSLIWTIILILSCLCGRTAGLGLTCSLPCVAVTANSAVMSDSLCEHDEEWEYVGLENACESPPMHPCCDTDVVHFDEDDHSQGTAGDDAGSFSCNTNVGQVAVQVTARPCSPLDAADNHLLEGISWQLQRLVQQQQLAMPWNRGLMGQVLGTSNVRPFRVWPPFIPMHVPMPSAIHVPAQEATPCSEPVNIISFATRRLATVVTPVGDDVLRCRAINKWRTIVEANLDCCAVGLQLKSMCILVGSDQQIIQVLQDVFANKATATLAKRANSMLDYVRWATEGQHIPRPTYHEEQAYAYICHLRDTSAPPTKASAFREALSFFHHVLGLKSAVQALESRRIAGACSSMFLLKRKLKQAPALTVKEVRLLENAAVNALVPEEKLAAGHLSLLYGRRPASPTRSILMC
jgi:hypothetical protein